MVVCVCVSCVGCGRVHESRGKGVQVLNTGWWEGSKIVDNGVVYFVRTA